MEGEWVGGGDTWVPRVGRGQLALCLHAVPEWEAGVRGPLLAGNLSVTCV